MPAEVYGLEGITRRTAKAYLIKAVLGFTVIICGINYNKPFFSLLAD